METEYVGSEIVDGPGRRRTQSHEDEREDSPASPPPPAKKKSGHEPSSPFARFLGRVCARNGGLIAVTDSESDSPPKSSTINKSKASTTRTSDGARPRPRPRSKPLSSVADANPSYTTLAQPSPPSDAHHGTVYAPATSGYRKHSRHWNPDGSLIVVVGGVGYRLSKSRLTKLSNALADVLKSPTAKAGKVPKWPGVGATLEKESDGGKIPVVQLDEATCVVGRDWERLVDVLDDPDFRDDPPSLSRVYSVLRASHALSIHTFEQWAREIVTDAWSDDLHELGSKIPQGADLVEVLNLGRSFALPGVVKRVMYELLKDEVFMQRSDDGDEGGSNPNGRLLLEDVLLLTSARAKLQLRWIRETVKFPRAQMKVPCLPSCIFCRKGGAGWAHQKLVVDGGMQEAYLNDVLAGFEALAKLPWAEEDGFCCRCAPIMAGLWRKARVQIWEECDELFGVYL
ncbi:hypothetical protein DFP72DRAFT_554691 [Ephemerocybe angulata]|uniref:Uncharacterized protein n=1 Tax=Ephemerocybe angulata TaxID=980116 RepID=A0A8H6HN65_9AGAR|nr:hypothetical protein DFP72DRAFT_554691 [Tulosesus angulatus]